MLSTRSSWRRLKISIRSKHSRRALPTHRSMCAFAFGAWTGVSDHPDPVAVEDGVEGATEFRITVVDQQPGLLAAIVEVHQRVARLLQHPGAVRVARARDVLDPAAADADEHEHVQPAPQDGVDGEEVAGQRRG